jgi:plastocyanin
MTLIPTRSLLSAFLITALTLPAADANNGSVRVEIKDPKGASVADAVASLTPLDAAVTVAPPAAPVAIVQEGEEFKPFVTAIVVGTQVNFPNRDKVQHHVFSVSKPKKFDLPLYRGEPRQTVLFDQPGVVSLGCNIHDWMSAYLVVLATPYFARSADDGRAAITGLPAGRYRLEVWHPRIKAVLQREITVVANDTATQVIAVTLGVDRRIRRAPESGTGGYK